MISLVGIIIVSVGVFGGYIMAGGNPAVIWQPIELIIIFGAAIGGLLTSSPAPLLKEMGRQTKLVFTGHDPDKAEYNELLLCLFELVRTAKGNLLALEAHVENPSGSEIFQRYPGVLKNHHLLEFMCDTLKVQISSPMSPYDLEDLMDKDIKTAHAEEEKAVTTMNRVSDALPGLGIVAAVLGVVITMGKLSQGKEVIGNSVAAALVGTFLGILFSYGYFQPLAAKMAENNVNHGKLFDVAKTCILAFAKECSPKVCIEFARRAVPPHIRPTFNEVDEATSNLKKAA